jgi:peroxiredoxin
MNKNNILLIVIVACLSVLVYLSISGGPADSPPPLPVMPPSATGLPPGHPPVGDQIKAPDFTLDSLSRGRISLSDFKGKVVVINFWSSTCPPCLIEMPSFERLKKAMAGKPFEVLTITPDPRPIAERTVQQLRLDLTVLLDLDSRVAMAYGAYVSPTTYIIAPDGAVDNRVMGAANWGDGSVVDYMNKLIDSASKTTDEG